MKLLLLSNSTNVGEEYLGFSKKEVQRFLGNKKLNIVFIPYAAVTFSYDEYEEKVNKAWCEIGHKVKSIHRFPSPEKAVYEADALVIGGGNTWKLVKTVQDKNLMEVIRERVRSGIPYIGWSAGANIACPTLKTTNDMPIAEPKEFTTLNLVPFQINPHYLDVSPLNHGGETREQRIEEFITENKDTFVVGLREGTLLHYENGILKLIGERPARIFKYGEKPRELTSSDKFDLLISKPHTPLT
ncbi:MAG: dipeptidase PepE [Flavobacteriaceae bacterium]|jgi:dipeptidase E|nr:dipeptidase PepE [Flavobacteriaceae bacterium]